jgi:predicted metal-dependent hydrolase
MSTPAPPDRESTLAAFEVAIASEKYFEAHEILEAYWVAYRGADRDFYRGLVQAAVALHHAATANAVGARGVAARARANLTPYAPRHDGIDVAAYLDRLDKAVV